LAEEGGRSFGSAVRACFVGDRSARSSDRTQRKPAGDRPGGNAFRGLVERGYRRGRRELTAACFGEICFAGPGRWRLDDDRA
jgi:hypothetical protein